MRVNWFLSPPPLTFHEAVIRNRINGGGRDLLKSFGLFKAAPTSNLDQLWSLAGLVKVVSGWSWDIPKDTFLSLSGRQSIAVAVFDHRHHEHSFPIIQLEFPGCEVCTPEAGWLAWLTDPGPVSSTTTHLVNLGWWCGLVVMPWAGLWGDAVLLFRSVGKVDVFQCNALPGSLDDMQKYRAWSWGNHLHEEVSRVCD